ncbi:cobalamin-binding protein [candidate division KSB3 bacterium]|uniref:Cobalamin-binding protein n=1 Tax=candidate division KSB3 bacterium TaxID=2044937 RepID=A0A9D5Q5T8_9BACT|nr:cobalamin-binding protein [candidate division KSB3 bacterium]MBD3324975.1 cobalamin-binding protein [candidate division KSB3 bacterium]
MKTLNAQLSQMLNQQQQHFAEQIVARQYALQPELWQSYGAKGRELCVRDVMYHFQYLSEAILAADPTLFADYVGWVKQLFAGLNFPDEVMLTTLECTRDILNESEEFSEEMMAIIDKHIQAGLEQMQQAPPASPSFIEAEAPLTGLLEQYIAALLQGERHVASQLILNAVDQGISIKAIYLEVFQRAQYEIGRLWMTNQISVAQEHYCTAATQLIISQLYPHIFATEKIGRRLVATCVGGELHEIGVRMVTDFFEMEGWDTYYLGANTPTTTILQTIETRTPDVLGVSATMTFHLSLVEELIGLARDMPAGQQLKILVGGYPFKKRPGLWQKLGADGFAQDAQEAIDIANTLLATE